MVTLDFAISVQMRCGALWIIASCDLSKINWELKATTTPLTFPRGRTA
jgi:hypothetical protein